MSPLILHRDLRAVRVTGDDARTWLQDLVTADVASLRTGELRQSLLLTPTGRIRAAFAVASDTEGFLLLQTTDQTDVAAALAPYVLSARVELAPDGRAFVSGPDALADLTDRIEGAEAWRPSLLPIVPPGGVLVGVAVDAIPAIRAWAVASGTAEADPDDADRLRVAAGIARFPVDLDEASLPAEAGWDDRIDATKGCFLGQESIAKVRNLGHPPRVVLALAADRAVAAGDAVLAGGLEVGVVTSAVASDGGSRLIARIRWDARGHALATVRGAALRPA